MKELKLSDLLNNNAKFKAATSKNKKTPFSFPNDVAVCYNAYVANGNASIGTTTRQFERNQILLQNLALTRDILINKYGCGENDYVGLPRTKIGDDDYLIYVNHQMIDAMMKEVEEGIDWKNLENVKSFIMDGDVCGRFYQENLIDAAKTQVKVDIKYDLPVVVRSMSLGEIKLMYSTKSRDLDFKVPEFNEEKYIVIEDEMYLFKLSMVKQLQEVFSDNLKNIKHELTGEELKAVEIFSLKKYEGLVKSIRKTALLYNDVIADHGYVASTVTDDDDIEQNRRKFKSRMALISNLIRNLTPDMDPIDRARLCLYVSITDYKGSIKAEGGNTFAVSCVPEEMLLMIAENAPVKDCGLPLIINHGYKEGDIVEFVHGRADLALIGDDISDELEIKMFNNKLYAVKPIKNVVNIPEVNPDAPIPVKLSMKSVVNPDEVKAMLASSEKVFLSSHIRSTGGVIDKDFAIRGLIDGNIIDIAELDTEGSEYFRLIDGKSASVVEVMDCKVKSFKYNKHVSSLIVCVKDLKDEEIPEVEIEVSDSLF